MSKMAIVVVGLILLTGIQAMAYNPPTEDELIQTVGNPEMISALISGASPSESIDVINSAIAKVSESTLTQEQKKEKVGEIINNAQKNLTEDEVIIVIPAVIAATDPSILPDVAAAPTVVTAPRELPIALPLAPPIAPRYEGQ